MAFANVLNEERFNPSRLNNLSLWLDAQSPSTISGTQSVTSWADKSGMGNTLVTTSSSIFLFTKSTVGLPTVHTGFIKVASSLDGMNLLACIQGGVIYTSVFLAGTYRWVKQSSAPISNWSAITSDLTGINAAACISGGGIYTSVNTGVTWSKQASAPNAGWASIASSSDGAKLAACVNSGGIYTRASSAASWLQSSAPASAWTSITSSLNGLKLAACINLGGIYTSTDSGVTWRLTSAPISKWTSIASSADGANLAAADMDTMVYISTDSGLTWTLKTNGLPSQYSMAWSSIASSSDGKRLVVVDMYSSALYTTIDGGLNWSKQSSGFLSSSVGWLSVAVNASGTQIVVADQYSDQIYVGQETTISSPILSNTLTNQPSVFFPLGSQMVSSLSSGLTSSKSIFMVYQCPQTASVMRFSVGEDVSGKAFGFAQSNSTVYSPYQYGYGDTKWTVDANTYILPNFVSGITDASATMIRGDYNFYAGAEIRETALVNNVLNTPYVLGTSTKATSVFSSGSFHVCEIIAYNRALSTTERQMIEGYVAWKWGMVSRLPIGHPYQKFPPSGEQVIAPSTPYDIFNGLVSWIDMADPTTYTLSGTFLKTLTDKAGGSFTISGKPFSLPVSTIGGLPSLNFPGNVTGTITTLTSPFLYKTLSVPSQGCAIAVMIPTSQFTASKLGMFGWGAPGNGSNNPGLGYNAPTTAVSTLQSYNTGTSVFYGPSLSTVPGSPTILFWAWYGGNMVYLSSNGNTILSGPQTAGVYNPASTNNIFYIGNDGGFGAQFNLGELCVYNGFLETPFRNILEGYLAWKWGTPKSLPNGHPYYMATPTLQTLTEVNALSQPADISGLTMWLDAADTNTLTSPPFRWLDKSPVSNNLSSAGVAPIVSNFGTPARPSVYFGPGTSLQSLYTSGAGGGQFSAFLVASVPTLSYLLISTGQITQSTTVNVGQSFSFFARGGAATPNVLSPYIVDGVGAVNNTVGSFSAVSGKTFELFGNISGKIISGNMNFATPPPSVTTNTVTAVAGTPWVFGDCLGDTSSKSFHVHEFITYSRNLLEIERQVVEGYLYWKWLI